MKQLQRGCSRHRRRHRRPAAYRAAVAAGKRAVVDRGRHRTARPARASGCMPSKLLIAAAEAAHAPANAGPEFGLRLDGSLRSRRQGRDGAREARARPLRRLRAGRRRRDSRRRTGSAATRVSSTTARSTVDGHTRIAFERAVIATGSSPAHPADAARCGRPAHRQRRRLRLGRPAAARSPIFGPGVIGLELGPGAAPAGRRRRCCSAARGHVGPFSDPAIRAYARAHVRSASCARARTPTCYGIERDGDAGRIALSRRRRRRTRRRASTTCIAATGRTPNVARARPRKHVARARRARRAACSTETTMQCGSAADLHRGRRQRRPAAAARSGRRGPDRRRERRALSRCPPAACGARRSRSCSPIRSSLSSARGMRDLAPGTFVTGAGLVREPGTKPRDAAQHAACCTSTSNIATGRDRSAPR